MPTSSFTEKAQHLKLLIQQDLSCTWGEINHSKFMVYYGALNTTLYVSISLLTKISGTWSLIFVHVAFLASQVVAPTFKLFLEPYRQITLIPLLTQISHLVVSTVIAKIFCAVFGMSFTKKQICTITIFFLISDKVAQSFQANFQKI